MTGWAFILLVWLAGAPAPVVDAAIYAKTREACETLRAEVHKRYEIGKPHPVIGLLEVRGIHAACLEIEKPPEGQNT